MSISTAELGSRQETEVAFGRDHPGYADTMALDEIRRTEFARLDRSGQVYLDYTGGGLYASSQTARAHAASRHRRVR
jgi:molybdenum cofactor sulfurtransferase